ncbi:hypothetical protein BGZ97_001521 [Linnemannia gamsii]|uniref:C2H2-type domain-containing protein n=1 Tax=Linnemannia gamsii TaxID=64522 RepID=A0A9P6R0D0_9FUNG|nr:hypothetical protein BGZ97_001521 [Linnemannia gamsii]
MHSNNTQVQVQIPAYYSLGSVAINGDLGFSGGGSTSFEHNQSAHSAASATTTLHPYNFPSNSVTSQFHPQSHNNHHHIAAHQQQQQQQQPSAYSQSYTSSQHSSNNNGNNNGNSAPSSHGYQTDLQKPLVQHHVNIEQSPHQALDENLMTPLINRQLNNQHSSNYHAPYNYHNHHHHNHNSSKQQQLRSPTSTPAPTAPSTLTTVSSASTPSLSSPSTLQSSQDYSYTANDGNNRQNSPISSASPASSTATSNSFHIPASPDQLTIGPAGLTQAMSTWTPSNGSVNQQQESTHSSSSSSAPAAAREYVSLGYNDSPKSARSPYYPQQGSPLYSQQDQQQQQAWVASMSTDDFSQQEILDQDRQQQPHQHHQRQYSQSNRNSYGQPSVATQQTSLTPTGGLPLLSPSSMLSSPDYQSSSYSMNMHDAPTIMSHLDYNRVTPSMPSMSSTAGNSSASSRYGPMRATHTKSRPPSVSSLRDFGNRTRTNSVNSTSSISSSGVLSSLATTLGSATIGGTELTATPEEYSRQLFDDEEEDSDSPTTIQMRPRCNTVPRKAIAARVFECSVPGCTKAYTQLHNLKSHERTGHTPIIKLKPFHCIIEGCSKAFSQRKSLATHIKTAHVDFKFKPFKCSQDGCTKAYTQLHNLRTHEKTVHMVDLSRKRIKNPMMGGSGGLPFDAKSGHGHGQMDYHHGSQHSGLGLNYDDFNGLTGLGMRMDNQHPYQRPHQPQQPQHHQHHQQQQQHHQYARLPHFNTMSAFHDRS